MFTDDDMIKRGELKKEFINDRIKEVRNIAIEELKIAAAQIGCNAVAGLDFDYVNMDRQVTHSNGGIVRTELCIILTANGTAVTIEPL